MRSYSYIARALSADTGVTIGDDFDGSRRMMAKDRTCDGHDELMMGFSFQHGKNCNSSVN